MRCSPHYHGEKRQKGSQYCNSECWHWKACLEELGLPKDYKTKIWYKRYSFKSKNLVWAVLKEKLPEV